MPAVYKILTKFDMQGQGGLNRYFYASNEAGKAKACGDVFTSLVMPAIVASVSNGLQFLRVETTEVTQENAAPHIIDLDDMVGDRSGDQLPVFNGYGYQLDSSTNSFRAGSKRIAGIAEPDQQDGVLVSGMDPIVDNVITQLLGVLTNEGSNYFPVLAREVTPTTWLVDQLVAGLYRRITTQNTRKVTSGGGPLSLGLFNEKAIWDPGSQDWIVNPAPAGIITPAGIWYASNPPLYGTIPVTPDTPQPIT